MKGHPSWEDLSDFMDNVGTDGEAIEAHLQECSVCARLYAEICRMREGLRTLPERPVSPDFTEKVLQAIAVREPQRRTILSWPRVLFPYAIAAVMLFGMGVYMFYSVERLKPTEEHTAATVPTVSTPRTAPSQADPGGMLLDESSIAARLAKCLAEDRTGVGLWEGSLVEAIPSDEEATEEDSEFLLGLALATLEDTSEQTTETLMETENFWDMPLFEESSDDPSVDFTPSALEESFRSAGSNRVDRVRSVRA
jgi:hypothetical protein